MRSPLIVVEDSQDWSPFADSPQVVTAAAYLAGAEQVPEARGVINLCRDGAYHSVGYYVSLLAEARGQRALPSVRTWLEAGAADPPVHGLRVRIGPSLRDGPLPERLEIHFGRTPDSRLASLAASVFNRFPAPILHATLRERGADLEVASVAIGRIDTLEDAEQTRFAEALDHFNHRIWRTAPSRKSRFDLAILVDPQEPLPPSNRTALKHFERAARGLGFDVELITLEDSPRLLEFDALFIRATTQIDHPTYQMARLAYEEGMAVIDDPDSILRCCNKVFLHDLLKTHRIGMPVTRLVMRQPVPDYAALIEALGLPLVLKVPDGSFSRGVFKVQTPEALRERCDELLGQSAVIIAQAFVPTEYDWRIGVLDGRALYACRYHMARNHWQIINHASQGGNRHGGSDCLPLAQVPGPILRTAVKAAKLIGNGLYGVDLKEIDGQPMVIEINDNPSIDAGVEDRILGEELYRQVMAHLMAAVQRRGRE